MESHKSMHRPQDKHTPKHGKNHLSVDLRGACVSGWQLVPEAGTRIEGSSTCQCKAHGAETIRARKC
jgi:hypothetical protein